RRKEVVSFPGGRVVRGPSAFVSAGCVLVFAFFLLETGAQARELSFQDRLEAQTALERVQYAHQIGATERFETALPRAVLEERVRAYLRQSKALETFWKTPVTDEMLEQELARMTQASRMPERLSELFAALHNDPFLIKECLARPALVERLTRNFHDYDRSLHADARRRAQEIRRD